MKSPNLTVAYVRVSTPEQEKHGYGIRIQRRDVRACAQRNSVPISRIFADEAESGVLENRTQLQKLLTACESGVIKTLIIPSLDRLSRDVRLAENLFWQFQQMGVEVLIADMPHYKASDRKAVFLRQIREAIDEENRKDIIEKLWKGRQERVRNGKPAGGTVPYGYRRHRKHFVRHHTEAEIVRTILEMDTVGCSDADITTKLNTLGFVRRNGQPWTRRQVLAISKRRHLYERGILRYGSVIATDQSLIIVGRAS